jgi:hypothetical protein
MAPVGASNVLGRRLKIDAIFLEAAKWALYGGCMNAQEVLEAGSRSGAYIKRGK